MRFFLAYIGALFIFGAVDAVWLTVMGPIMYRPALGEILAANVRIAPAIAFYLVYPIGIVAFAVIPALKAGSPGDAFALAALFGAIAYATYDLTNYATLRVWSLQITVLDVAYGALASGTAAAAVFFLFRLVTR